MPQPNDRKNVNLSIVLNPALDTECETETMSIWNAKGEITIIFKFLNGCRLDINLEKIKVMLRFTGFIDEYQSMKTGKTIVNLGCIWGK